MRSFPVQKSVLNSIPLVTNETARKLIKKVNIKVFSVAFDWPFFKRLIRCLIRWENMGVNF